MNSRPDLIVYHHQNLVAYVVHTAGTEPDVTEPPVNYMPYLPQLGIRVGDLTISLINQCTYVYAIRIRTDVDWMTEEVLVKHTNCVCTYIAEHFTPTTSWVEMGLLVV